MKIKILIPIYNDWQSVQKLIKDIDILINDLPSEGIELVIETDLINLSPFKNLIEV